MPESGRRNVRCLFGAKIQARIQGRAPGSEEADVNGRLRSRGCGCASEQQQEKDPPGSSVIGDSHIGSNANADTVAEQYPERRRVELFRY